MNFASLATPGVITGIVTFVAAVLTAFGYKPLATFLSSPDTAQTLQTVIVGIAALVAGGMKGLQKPDKP